MSSHTFYQPSVFEEYINVALTYNLGNFAGTVLMKTSKTKYRHKDKSRPDTTVVSVFIAQSILAFYDDFYTLNNLVCGPKQNG